MLVFLHSELIEVGKDRIPHPLAEFTNSSKFRLIKNFWQCLTFKNKKNHFYACKLLSPTDKKNKKWNWTGYFAKYFKIFCLYCFEFWFLLDWCHMQRPFTISSVLMETIICQNVLDRVKIWMRNLLTRAKLTWFNQSMAKIIHYERPCKYWTVGPFCRKHLTISYFTTKIRIRIVSP